MCAGPDVQVRTGFAGVPYPVQERLGSGRRLDAPEMRTRWGGELKEIVLMRRASTLSTA